MGQRQAALALLCQSEHVAAAMAAAGKECPGRLAELTPAAGNVDESVVPVRRITLFEKCGIALVELGMFC